MLYYMNDWTLYFCLWIHGFSNTSIFTMWLDVWFMIYLLIFSFKNFTFLFLLPFPYGSLLRTIDFVAEGTSSDGKKPPQEWGTRPFMLLKTSFCISPCWDDIFWDKKYLYLLSYVFATVYNFCDFSNSIFWYYKYLYGHIVDNV